MFYQVRNSVDTAAAITNMFGVHLNVRFKYVVKFQSEQRKIERGIADELFFSYLLDLYIE